MQPVRWIKVEKYNTGLGAGDDLKQSTGNLR